MKAGTPRSISARFATQVFVREQTAVRVCGPSRQALRIKPVLQVDHIKPVARGGAGTIDNLRLLCAYHNRLEAERLMGRSGPPTGVIKA